MLLSFGQPRPKPRYLQVLVWAAGAVLLDQIAKGLAQGALIPGEPIALLPFFSLSLGFNTGASFGLLSGVMAEQPLLMAALTGLITVGFIVLALRSTQGGERIGLALVVGGALGNIIDRVTGGAVVDFIHLHWRDWHWPTFNLADVAITTGALLVFAVSLLQKSKAAARG